uniref:Transmembrane protein 26b n=1 Tax=Oryzias melastigma TaxID=30732 RepID=A0A3B3C3K0_ORYME
MFSRFISAVVTRSLFILVSLLAVWRVVGVTGNKLYYLLTILYLPLVVEMVLTLKKRHGSDYKWFSPAVFFFLVSIIPSIWILELHYHSHLSESQKCLHLDSADDFKKLWKNSRYLSLVCNKDWTLALHQIMIILLILGKWLLPAAGELNRDRLSQLLLVFVGTAADILEFVAETLGDIQDSSLTMVCIILSVWTWSMLQFPLHLSGTNTLTSSEDVTDQPDQASVYLSINIWSTLEALFIQDGPFLVVRLSVMFHFKLVHQMLIFFAIKNFLVVILNVYRFYILFSKTT